MEQQVNLRISTIVLENFKSWFGKHVIQLDPTRFTAIVGANGSGKSNIIDALLFVFGWRAKQLRQPKLTDLIHYSDQRPDFARVQIDFVNGDQFFSVGRVIKQSGQSYYEVNQKRETLEAVQQILIENGMDISHNRFLILQGEVESISMMKPAGDDLLGLMTQQQLSNLQQMRDMCNKLSIDFDPQNYHNIYETLSKMDLKEHSQQFAKLVKIDDMQQQEQGLLEFIEQIVGTNESIPRIAYQSALVEFINQVKLEIRQQLQAAVQYRDQLNEIKDDSVQKLRKQSNEILEQMNGAMYDASSSRIQIQLKKQENDVLQKNYEAMNNGQIQELNQNLQQCEEKIDQLRGQQAQNQLEIQDEDSKFKSVNTEVKLLNDRVQQFQKDSVESGSKLQKIQESIQALELEYNQIPIKTKQIDDQITNIQLTIQQKEDQLSKQQQETESNNVQINQIKDQISNYEKKLQPISQVRTQYQSKLDISRKQAGGRLSQLVDQSISVASGIMKINQLLNYKNPRLTKLIAQQEDIKNKISQTNVQKQKQQFELLQTQLNTVNQELQMIDLKISEINSQKQDNHKQSKLLSSIMNLVKTGQLTGVYGRLGNLGKIDGQLNTAAIAAFGGQLDYIVCDNMEVIQQCLEHIREKQLGYASFIDLSQVTVRRQQSGSQIDLGFVESQGAALFLQLVQTEAQFVPAFWHVMGETVVCDNTDIAIILNKNQGYKQKIRVVTKEGEVYEKGGSLTGGSIKSLLARFQGFTNIQTSQSDIHELEKQRQGLGTRQDTLQSQVENMEKDIKNYDLLKQSLESLAEDINAQQYEISQIQIKLQSEVQNIKSTNDNSTIQFCQGYVNRTLMDELDQLERHIIGSQMINIQQCRQIIPGVLEIVEYYTKQRLTNEENIREYALSLDPLDILEGDSDISNLIQFSNPLTEILQLQASESIKKEVDNLILQEKSIEENIGALQVKLNHFGNVKQYQILRKDIQQLNGQLQELQKTQKHLQVQEVRFQPQKDRLIAQHIEISEKLEKIENNLHLSQNELDLKLEAQHQQKQIIKQLQLISTQIQAQIEQSTNQHRELELQLNQLNSQLIKLKQSIQQNQDLISKSIDIISASEEHINVCMQLLMQIQQELLKAEEIIEFQPPLFSNHENVEELDIYDQSIYAKFQQCKKNKSFIGFNLNSVFINEFRILTDYQQRVQQLMHQQQIFSQVQKDYEDQLLQLNSFKEIRSQTFLSSFNEINSRLREIYRVFSMGGDATLELADAFDPFQGLNYSVMPPKKAWRAIQNLSGGEKTLSSLSLIFALHQYKKNFIYVVDEIDAALDFRNVSLVANYLKEQAKDCQFVIISLRNNTFEVADSLIGIYKVENKSKHVTLNLE